MTNQLTDTQKQLVALISQFIIAGIALYNYVAPMYNLPCFVLGNDVITGAVTFVILAAVFFWNGWKNRNVTWQSQLSQKVLDGLKSGVIAPEAVDEMIEEQQQEFDDNLEDLNKEIEQEVEEFMEKQDAIDEKEVSQDDEPIA